MPTAISNVTVPWGTGNFARGTTGWTGRAEPPAKRIGRWGKTNFL